MFDYLLQFYWPHGQRKSGKTTERRRNRRAITPAALVAAACVVLLLGSSDASYGEEFRKLSDRRNLIFDRLGSEDGLSQAGISAIVQDDIGFIWVGTQEGLYRYDGHSFTTYYQMEDQPESLSHDTIWALLPDGDGRVWVGTDAGLNRYDPATDAFEHFPLDESGDAGKRHDVIHALLRDADGNVWVGSGLGLSRYEGNGEFEHFRHDPFEPDTIGRGSVRALLEDSSGNLWVGTEQGGLQRFDRRDGTFRHFTRETGLLRDNYVRDIIEDDGKLWVSTFNGGISIFDPAVETSRHIQAGGGFNLANNRVRALLKDQSGDIWVGTDGGLHLWDRELEQLTRYTYDPTDPKSISDNTVFVLYQDRGGVVWVGTFNGISKWNANIDTFPHFRRGPEEGHRLSNNSVTSFAEVGKDIYIGTFDGLNRWNGNTGKFDLVLDSRTDLTEDMVMSLDSRGDELWVGTMSGGVNIVRDGVVVDSFVHRVGDDTSLSGNAVSDILVDSKGDVWLTTWGGGVSLYLGDGRFRRYPDPRVPDGEFSDLRAVAIEEAPDGRMWIATDGGGVVILDPETARTEHLRLDEDDPAGLGSDNVISLLYASGSMWVGTRDRGISRYRQDTGDFEHFTKTDGLASDAVYGMLEDDRGNLWISGGKGLSVLQPSTGEFATYDATHGLQSDDFNSGAYLELADGSFLFGGNNGFNAFDPALIKGNTYVPPIVVTEFSKFNEPFSLDNPIFGADEIEIDYDDFVIGFEFSAMDFTAPEKNRFQYRLEGFDRDWVEARPGTRSVTYTNLDPGHYRFHVRGSNNDGVWNLRGASIGLMVRPPIWATWWAYLGYLCLGLFALYQVQKANERRLRRDAEKRYSERLQLYIESLEEATDCVLIADSNKNLMYANNAIEDILGLSPAQSVGRSILSLLFADVADANAARQGLEREGRWHGEVTSVREGQTVTTEVTIASVKDDAENETAYVSIARDITDRKRTQAELENHRKNLEFLVAERTKALEREISENKAFQRDLANSLREKELLLKEVHHRVKNNMQVISSLLNIQAETIGNEEFASLLGESQQRIKSMSLIHENLYQSDNLLEIDFEDYIRMLANSLCRFYTIPGVSVNLNVNVEDVSLDIETAVPCGLIINELISNSLKHAFNDREGSATISVSFRNMGCQYVLAICDDGSGLPEGFDPAASSSMGMEIVSILTQQLDGRLEVSSGEGARFEISFPRKEKANA